MSESKQPQKKVIVLSHDVAGSLMAGPGIRYTSVAIELSKHFDTTLGILNGKQDQVDEISSNYGINARSYDNKNYKSLIDKADYIFVQDISLKMLRYARKHRKNIIFDLYSPVPIEFMIYRHFSASGYGKTEKQELSRLVNKYNLFSNYGDYFVCSNERQLDLWTGFFLSSGRLSSDTNAFTDISQLIGLAPMGIPNTKPAHTKNVLRNTVPGIEDDDFVLLWTGGLWDWFDPLKVIEAVEQLHSSNPAVKLVFMGFKHPNKKVSYMKEAQKAVAYSKERGLENQCVFFIDEWVPYNDRLNYMLESDAAIYAHKPSLETRYSHRSRVLDHIYTNLPTIANGGDYLGDMWLKDKQLGLITESSSSQAFVESITTLMRDSSLLEDIKKNIDSAKQELFWDNSIKDLTDYIHKKEPTSSLPTKIKATRTSGGVVFFLRRVIRKIKRYVS